jgi:hypothetical protein
VILCDLLHEDDDSGYISDPEWEMSTVRGTYDILFIHVEINYMC